MGSYLSMNDGISVNKNPEIKQNINKIRNQLTLEKLCNAFNEYMTECYPQEELTWEQFDSIFSPIFNNCEPLFRAFVERHTVNIYEIIIAMVVFVKGVEFEDKLLFIFKTFDVDSGGSLDRKELSKFLMCAIVGLCKIIG